MKFNNMSEIGSSQKSGIFHLKDLNTRINPNGTESIYAEFNIEFKREFYKDILKAFKTVTNLSKEIDVNFTKLWDQITRVPFSLSVLKKICNIMENKGFSRYSLNNLENKIYYMKSGGSKSDRLYNPNFPINLVSLEGMRFISHIYHDGSIGKCNKQPHYRNYFKNECLEFLEDGKKLFGKFNRYIKKNKDGTYSVHLPTVIGEIMIAIGYCPGDKTKQNPKTFGFLNYVKDKKLISEFLAKAFNDDGFVGRRTVGLQQSSLIKNGFKETSNVLMLDKLFLNRLNIKVKGPIFRGTYNNRYGICTNYAINIYSKYFLRKFNDNINLIEYKKKKLETYLNKQ